MKTQEILHGSIYRPHVPPRCEQIHYLVNSTNLIGKILFKYSLCLRASFTKHKQMIGIHNFRPTLPGINNKNGKFVPPNTKRMIRITETK